MSAVLLLLYVTLMPFAPILVDRTAVSARLDTVAMEKLAKVGENTLFGGFLELVLVIFIFNLEYKLPPPQRILKSEKPNKMSEGRITPW